MPRICAAFFVVLLTPGVSAPAAQAAQEKPTPSPGAAPAPAAQLQGDKAQVPAPAVEPLIPPKESSVLGELEIITINSKVFRNIRNLRVWLPANYFAPVNRNKHYPVLYMQDGQNLFDEATAFNHEWKFDETVELLTG